jgi:GNAT superfamily N-acetyltransferase
VSPEVIFRPATATDLPAILALLADDDIARDRGTYPTALAPTATTTRRTTEPTTEPRGEPTTEPTGEPTTEPTGEPITRGLLAAFAAIDADPRNELVVADECGAVVGTCQLTFIPGLSRGGAERMTIEAVRIRPDRRGAGIGRHMMAYALNRAKERGCALAQLTTDKRRSDAHRFYESLGFVASHEGMKLVF